MQVPASTVTNENYEAFNANYFTSCSTEISPDQDYTSAN